MVEASAECVFDELLKSAYNDWPDTRVRRFELRRIDEVEREEKVEPRLRYRAKRGKRLLANPALCYFD